MASTPEPPTSGEAAEPAPDPHSTSPPRQEHQSLDIPVGDGDGMISVDSRDDDSAIGDLSRAASVFSVRSSVYDYVVENGRTYHRFKEGNYVMPNDEIEQDRLDMQHHVWCMALHDHLFLAPIKPNPQNVLDMGTGTGIWAIDFADRYPSAQVIGNDLSPIQPNYIPGNCTFEIDDVEDTWTYSQKFDLIHGRLLVSCFKDHRAVLERAFDALAPGGYLEMQDADFPMKCVDDSLIGTALWKWNMCIQEGAEKVGKPWTRTKQYKEWMEEIGFLDVEERIFPWPINTWPRDPHLKALGLWFQHDLLEGLNSTTALLTREEGLGWSTEEVESLLVDVRKDIENRRVHAYVPMHVVYGRKPG